MFSFFRNNHDTGWINHPKSGSETRFLVSFGGTSWLVKLSLVSQIVSEIDVSELLTFFLAVHGTNIAQNRWVKHILSIKVCTVPNTCLPTSKPPEHFTKHVLNKATLFWNTQVCFCEVVDYTEWSRLHKGWHEVRTTTEVYTTVPAVCSPSYSFS